MILLVTGGRDYNDRAAIYSALTLLHATYPVSTLIHGCARGVDTICGQWATDNHIPVVRCPADWETHGKAAGAIRNAEMLQHNPTYLVAFPGGRGTADMVRKARAAGLTVWMPYGGL